MRSATQLYYTHLLEPKGGIHRLAHRRRYDVAVPPVCRSFVYTPLAQQLPDASASVPRISPQKVQI